MIENRINAVNVEIDKYEDDGFKSLYHLFGKHWALTELSSHLQEYIEGLVSQAENQLGQGE